MELGHADWNPSRLVARRPLETVRRENDRPSWVTRSLPHQPEGCKTRNQQYSWEVGVIRQESLLLNLDGPRLRPPNLSLELVPGTMGPDSSGLSLPGWFQTYQELHVSLRFGSAAM